MQLQERKDEFILFEILHFYIATKWNNINGKKTIISWFLEKYLNSILCSLQFTVISIVNLYTTYKIRQKMVF